MASAPAACLVVLVGVLALLAGCESAAHPARVPPLAQVPANAAASARINGNVGSPEAPPPALVSLGAGGTLAVPAAAPGAAAPEAAGGDTGDVSLDFADTDLREVVAQILGGVLKLNYTIDPAVHGSVTLRTVTPLPRSQLISVLQALLGQNGATLAQSGGIWRVLPASASTAPNLAGSAEAAGSTVVQLRYAGAQDLANLLQPFVGNEAKIAVDSSRNLLLVSGDPAVRQTVVSLIGAFDTDVLAGQSYALLPVADDDAQGFAAALQDALQTQNGGTLAGLVRVVPMTRVNAVLVVARDPRYIADTQRIYALVEQARSQTVRSWHVYYLQDSRSNDIAYVLQQAFTPGHVTAQPSGGPGSLAPGYTGQQFGTTEVGGMNGGMNGGGGGVPAAPGGLASGLGSGPAGGPAGGMAGGGFAGAAGPAAAAGPPPGAHGIGPGPDQGAAAALTGPLEQSSGEGAPEGIRIIPDAQNNAILSYATPREEQTIEAMLRKLDIIPLQVRIDATIAEVTLNDQLQYGTQFFFKSGGINGALSFANQNLTGAIPGTVGTLATSFPGFVLGGNGLGGAPFAISALQAVTTVDVLSSPQLLVLDNQTARLQVGSLVPYLTQTSQSTLTNEAPVINSIDYRQTGVIMDVTPRVNSGGLVTLDIGQEVSDVDTSGPTTQGIDSPTFLERNVTSRVVIQDGQTVGLAGLIRDNSSRGNQGIPWLKDVPVLGLLAGQQTNTRARTELLVLITPHVMHDQRDARDLTADLRDELRSAALVPSTLNTLPLSGSPDPGEALRRKLHLQP